MRHYVTKERGWKIVFQWKETLLIGLLIGLCLGAGFGWFLAGRYQANIWKSSVRLLEIENRGLMNIIYGEPEDGQ